MGQNPQFSRSHFSNFPEVEDIPHSPLCKNRLIALTEEIWEFSLLMDTHCRGGWCGCLLQGVGAPAASVRSQPPTNSFTTTATTASRPADNRFPSHLHARRQPAAPSSPSWGTEAGGRKGRRQTGRQPPAHHPPAGGWPLHYRPPSVYRRRGSSGYPAFRQHWSCAGYPNIAAVRYRGDERPSAGSAGRAQDATGWLIPQQRWASAGDAGEWGGGGGECEVWNGEIWCGPGHDLVILGGGGGVKWASLGFWLTHPPTHPRKPPSPPRYRGGRAFNWGINGQYRSTECPRHRQFQPLVQLSTGIRGGGGSIQPPV